ncbi:MAG: hypothetical protein KDF54_05185 [Hydrogenophaga sp.]|nr:hypothetical protein [Hydrogenophaga sp.]
MRQDEEKPDSPPTKAELELIGRLTAEQVDQIDRELLATCSPRWRKVAMVVGTMMMNLKTRVAGIPDTYYAQRVAKLVADGRLEAQGNLQYMRYSEVRLPAR